MDFCKGRIIDSSFIDCGNDAIDISGSNVEIKNISITRAGDKGLSVGEKSQMVADSIDIKGTGLAVASKDASEINMDNIKLYDCEVGLALYQKKAGLGPVSINAQRLMMDKLDVEYLVEQGSILNIKGKRIKSDQEFVKEILAKYI